MCAFGTFDSIHPGHIAYLHFAKTFGNALVVVVTRDDVAKVRKGTMPRMTEKDRAAIVAELRSVDSVIFGDYDDSWNILLTVRPDIICFGYDQHDAKQSLEMSPAYTALGSPSIIIASAFNPQQFHSRILKTKI